MSPVFSPDIIARVKDETDIVEIVRQHVSLKQAGAVFKGLCPFHKEKTPSFIVTPARQRWHCFGCSNGGDVISFLMEVEGVTRPPRTCGVMPCGISGWVARPWSTSRAGVSATRSCGISTWVGRPEYRAGWKKG
jgi:hypothetical protein